MKTLPEMDPFAARRWGIILLAAIAALGATSYFVGIPHNPPGFYIDESSICYNAHTIAQSGRDEFGAYFPLYFRAFGDYKNPVYLYLLGGFYYLTGPSVLVARLLSGVLGILAALTLGALAARSSRSVIVALLTIVLALSTPWLFETSRVVLEVALYPLAIALFLLCLERLAQKSKWSPLDVASLAAALALLTYSYSIGRLLAPLLALGLVFFFNRQRWIGVLQVWAAYAVALIPLFIFNQRHPGALTGRFKIITYLTPGSSYAESAAEFARHYVANFNLWRLLWIGDPNPDQITHIFGTGHFLLAAFVLSGLGAFLVLRFHRSDPWWRFIFYALAVSAVPASLTNESFHMLRLIALPVFLLVFTIPALAWSLEKRPRHIALTLLLGFVILQAAVFQWKYHRAAQTPRRLHLFDAGYQQTIFAPAMASASGPIYLADALAIPGYIQAYWNATLQGIDLARFVRLPAEEPPPTGALVISTEENCPRCQIIASDEPYTLYVANDPARLRFPLPDEGFQAQIAVITSPPKVRATKQATVVVKVKNISPVVWLARERSGGEYQVSLGNHWLNAKGETVIGDDGRRALLRDLQSGEEIELSLVVNAPRQPGDYLLEVDMLQESVSWFALKGSRTVRVPVRVE